MTETKLKKLHEGNSKLNIFDELLQEKQDKLLELKDAVNSEVTLKLDYEHKFNELLLSSTLTEEVKKATGENRPTKDMKESFIVEELKVEYDALQLAIENSKLIRKDLELIDNRIGLEKYVLQMELKE